MLPCDGKSLRPARISKHGPKRICTAYGRLSRHAGSVSSTATWLSAASRDTAPFRPKSSAGARTELAQEDGASLGSGLNGKSEVVPANGSAAAEKGLDRVASAPVESTAATLEAITDGSAASCAVPSDFPKAGGNSSPLQETQVGKPPAKYQLLKRVLVGMALGLFGAVVILTGKKMYLCAVGFIVYLATTEYFGFLTSKGISKGMTPPPRTVSIATTVLCISITIATFLLKGQYHGTTLSVAAVALLACNIVALKKPTFSMLVTSLFGLIYCGWLPSFWVKLRFVSTPLDYGNAIIPSLLSGWVSWTLGLAVTFTAVACVAAADIGAFFVGKNLGRTQLTEISPKKTVEGAIGGLLSSVATAMILAQLLSWPPSPWVACVFGVLIFFSSLCGDLVESVMKREAEMKDSGSLFPGHGGLLDRFDSYIFTGAVVYGFAIVALPRMCLL